MPLIIAILAIIVLCSWANSSSKEGARAQTYHDACARKTDAETERALVDKYMKTGMLFDDAFEMARSDMIKNGFDPCIPKTAYRSRGSIDINTSWSTSECYRCRDYDSEAVKHIRNDYKSECEQKGVPYSESDARRYIYESGRLPKNAAQYEAYLDRNLRSKRHKAVAVGKYIVYSGFGTCEVVDLDFEKSMHTVKVLRTGEILHVPFGSNRITKL